MNPGTQIILSGTLTFGVPLMLAVRDLIAMRRSSDGYWRPEPPDPVSPPPVTGSGPAVPALPACLLEAAKGRPFADRPAEPAFADLLRVPAARGATTTV